MYIGIDFNTKTMRATVLNKDTAIGAENFFEIRNMLAFANNEMFIGEEALSRFLTEKKASIYNLDQIVDFNGLIINKKQVSVAKCLSILFDNLLEKIDTNIDKSKIDYICISIPYDKFYFWKDSIHKAFSLIDIKKIRVMSQPAAFFSQSDIDYFHRNIIKRNIEKKDNILINEWKREYEIESSYLFISISKQNSNISLVNYLESILDIIGTQYTDVFSENYINDLTLKYFLSEINNNFSDCNTEDKKIIFRIKQAIDELFEMSANQHYQLSLPYVLFKDGSYKTIEIDIAIVNLHKFLEEALKKLLNVIEVLAHNVQISHKKSIYQNIILIGSPFIENYLNEKLKETFSESQIICGSQKSLAIGALDWCKILTGERTDFLALEVMPFSLVGRLQQGKFIEFLSKDTTIPSYKEHNFILDKRLKFAEIHLGSKEGENIQNLNVWRIEVNGEQSFKIAVSIDFNGIKLEAFSKNGVKLSVKQSDTFSFNGIGFEVGIKGKNLREYILNQFNYLDAVIKSEELTIIDPTDQFYSWLSWGRSEKALNYLGEKLKLKNLPDIELSNSEIFAERGVAGFLKDKKISISKRFKDDPHGFGYVLAHELAHYILIHEEGILLDDEQENEILTEIFVVYKGMGKLFLNGFETKGASEFTDSRGYLDKEIIKYIHEIYFEKFNIDRNEYQKLLTKDGQKMLE